MKKWTRQEEELALEIGIELGLSVDPNAPKLKPSDWERFALLMKERGTPLGIAHDCMTAWRYYSRFMFPRQKNAAGRKKGFRFIECPEFDNLGPRPRGHKSGLKKRRRDSKAAKEEEAQAKKAKVDVEQKDLGEIQVGQQNNGEMQVEQSQQAEEVHQQDIDEIEAAQTQAFYELMQGFEPLVEGAEPMTDEDASFMNDLMMEDMELEPIAC